MLTAPDRVVEAPLVTVVVPVRNDEPGLRVCMQALLEQSPSHTFEVIIVDNGSTPPVLAWDDPRVRVIREERPGSYAARNRGVEQANGRVIAFTDADTVPGPDWIQRAAEVLRGAAPLALAGRIRVTIRDRPHPVELFEAVTLFDQADCVERLGFGATANLVTTRETLEGIGLFDARLASGGDLEWCRRLTDAGGRLHYDDALVVDHPARTSWRAEYRRLRRVMLGRRALSRRIDFDSAPAWKAWVPPAGSIRRALDHRAVRGRPVRDRLLLVLGMTGVRYQQLWVSLTARKERIE